MWLSVLAVDEDAHEVGLAVVAARNPFREQGPPANMAKLILLRHKVSFRPCPGGGWPYQPSCQIQTTNRKRRSPSHARQPPRTCNQSLSRQASSPWMRFGKAFGGKQYH
ncbi:hypothetical protein C8R44DRAFT_621581 [Mycena epipterygia]|nr:hypothetical protein C8R44DRAFT_621581 [Mycena epipterygia]